MHAAAKDRRLPPGQHSIRDFPRFGSRHSRPPGVGPLKLDVRRGGRTVAELGLDAWEALPRRSQKSDFHCVTTWTSPGHTWEGVGFDAFCAALGLDEADGTRLVVFQAADGYSAALPLHDLRRADVLLADHLDGWRLCLAHGAPLRLVAPAHYGYKSVKHLVGIDFGVDPKAYRPPGIGFMIHPRARVALEERGVGVPGWLLRVLYRPLIRPTAARFARGLREAGR